MDTPGKKLFFKQLQRRYGLLRGATFLWVAKYAKELETWNRDLWMHGLLVEVNWGMQEAYLDGKQDHEAAKIAWFAGEKGNWVNQLHGDEHAKMTVVRKIYDARYSKYADAKVQEENFKTLQSVATEDAFRVLQQINIANETFWHVDSGIVECYVRKELQD